MEKFKNQIIMMKKIIMDILNDDPTVNFLAVRNCTDSLRTMCIMNGNIIMRIYEYDVEYEHATKVFEEIISLKQYTEGVQYYTTCTLKDMEYILQY